MANKTKRIATINIKGQEISVRASEHCLARMAERGVSEFVVAGNIVSLGDKLAEIQSGKEEGIVIDEVNKCAVIFGFKPQAPNTCFIITVINRANVFVKNSTRIYRLAA